MIRNPRKASPGCTSQNIGTFWIAQPNLPYSVFQKRIVKLSGQTSHNLRHLALIDMQGCKYRQLPLCNSQLLRVTDHHAAQTRHDQETEYEFILEAKRRLCGFALDKTDKYASIRFMCMTWTDTAKEVEAETDKIIDELTTLMNQDELETIWHARHPHRMAAVATYAYFSVAEHLEAASRLHAWLFPKPL